MNTMNTNSCITSADNGPRCTVINHFLVGLCRARCGLELDDSVLRQAQVHTFCLLHVECNLGGDKDTICVYTVVRSLSEIAAVLAVTKINILECCLS